MRRISGLNLQDFAHRILRSKSLGTYSAMVSANMLSTVIGGIAGVVQARWVTPDVLGAFGKYSILTGYAAVLSMVVVEGLVRQFPYLIGKGQVDRAVRTAGVAKCWYAMILVIMTVVFLGLSLWALIRHNYFGAVGWASQIFVYLSISYGAFLQIIYRRSGEFKRLSYNGLIAAVVECAALIFVKMWGFFGLAIRVVFWKIIRFWLDAKYMPMKIPFYWERGIFVELAKISIPISFIGYIKTSFMNSSFNALVLYYCGQRDLGLLGIAGSFQAIAMMFIQSFNQIFGVKMAVKFGETDSVRKTLATVIVPTVLCFVASLLLAVLFALSIVPFIKYVTPHYVDAIPIIWILAAAIPLNALSLPMEIFKTALLIKNMYAIGLTKVIVVLMAAYLVPHSIFWLAGCLVLGGLVDIIMGAWFVCCAIRKERKIL